jgi:hypothetical protein
MDVGWGVGWDLLPQAPRRLQLWRVYGGLLLAKNQCTVLLGSSGLGWPTDVAGMVII